MRRILAVILLFMCASALASAQSGDASRQKLKQGDKGAGKPGANAARQTPPLTVTDTYTPVVASVLSPPTFFVPGTDGKYHIAYDVELQNTHPATAAVLVEVDVVDAGKRVLVSMGVPEMVRRLRTLDARPVGNTIIEPNGSRVLFIELTFDSLAQAPKVFLHNLSLKGAKSPADNKQSSHNYTILPYNVAAAKPFTIGPPLAGKGWVATNGCCAPGRPHRSSFVPVNGWLVNAQRFAIDWMRMNDDGYMVVGDPSKNENWANYGADVLAVADGTVIETLDEFDDNKPGDLPDPTTITVKNIGGNHIVLDIGNGLYGFYAHLKRGSLKVRVGDHVRKGDKLALLGNTGNSSAPHLHFHIMDSPSVMGSNGVPYVIESFEYDGQVPLDLFERAFGHFEKSNELTEKFGGGRLAMPQRRKGQYPLAWDIINFP
jgi:murein DD-endopeptidase MepM/ murein hydrolase activator NlpD